MLVIYYICRISGWRLATSNCPILLKCLMGGLDPGDPTEGLKPCLGLLNMYI